MSATPNRNTPQPADVPMDNNPDGFLQYVFGAAGIPNDNNKAISVQSPEQIRHISIALQGGGSWGAFAWGVLDRLLEDPSIRIDEIAGTSAGAMNGAVVAHAVNTAKSYEDGARKAREELARFWARVCDSNHTLMALLSITHNGPMAGFADPVKNPNLPALSWIQTGKDMIDSNPFAHMMGLSGYFNRVVEGMATTKLRTLVRDFIPSFDAIREGRHMKLHVNAAKLTDSGYKNVVFSGGDLSIDAVMASATLRRLFKPVEIKGELYYDGGYSENPTLSPLEGKKDILWIMTNPPRDKITPRPQSAFKDEDLRGTNGLVLYQSYDHLAHAVKNAGKSHHHAIWFDAPDHYDQTSKQNTEKAFLAHLFHSGRAAADAFLKAHKADLGQKTTVDIAALQKEAARRTAARGAWRDPRKP